MNIIINPVKAIILACVLTGMSMASAQNRTERTTELTPDAGILGGMVPLKYIAVKTNLLYDAAAILNIAAEVGVNNHLSAEIPISWSFWDMETDRGLRIVALQPGIRYYLDRIGTGHAFGTDISLAWYNLKYRRHRYQDTGRPLLGLGINYSYTLPLTPNWKAEFLLGIGYFNTKYNTYYNISDGARISTRVRNYFGPTRMGITLIYSL